MKAYFGAKKFEDVMRMFPEFGIARANYKPEFVWQEMRKLGYERSRGPFHSIGELKITR
jgi:hypothetical protein